jgi:hypothetical protein
MAVAYRNSAVDTHTTTTTAFDIVIPTVVTDDVLILTCINRDNKAAPTISDNDTGGNSWALLLGSNVETPGFDVYWKRATGSTSGKTISGSGFTGSCAAALSVFSGCIATGNPYENASAETHVYILGEPPDPDTEEYTHTGFTTSTNGSCVVLCVGIQDNLTIAGQASANFGSMTTNKADFLSTGGNDSAVSLAYALAATAGATGTFSWTDNNYASKSIAFTLLPTAGVTVTPSPATLVCATVNPTIGLSSVSKTPAAATLVAATVNPTVVLGSVTMTPSPATLICGAYFHKRPLGWANEAVTFRRKLTFRADHPELPADYTAEFNLPTGTRYKIASDGCFNQAVREPSFQVIDMNGKTHVTYLSHISDVDYQYGVSVQSYDHFTKEWGTPYRVDNAKTSEDPHNYPNIVRDSNGYLHLFYGTHSGSLYHAVSNAPDQSGALPGEDSGWALKGVVASPTSYPMPICDETSGLMFVFFRSNYPDHDEGTLSFIYSSDDGDTWSNEMAAAINDIEYNGRLYTYGFYYDQVSQRLHIGFSFLNGDNISEGIWYAYSDLEPGTAPYFRTWYTIADVECGTAVDPGDLPCTTTLAATCSYGATSATLTATTGLEVGFFLRLYDWETLGEDTVTLTGVNHETKAVTWTGGITHNFYVSTTTVLDSARNYVISSVSAGLVIESTADDSMRYFCRYLTLLAPDDNGVRWPLIVVSEENGLRGPYDDVAFGVSRYYSGAWHHTSISEAHDITIHDTLNPTICDRDGKLHMFTGQDSRCFKRHVPTGNGNYTTATQVGAGSSKYEAVDDGIHAWDKDTTYLYGNTAAQKCSFTSSKTLPVEAAILKVGVETVTKRVSGTYANTYKHFLRIGGTDHEGEAVAVTTSSKIYATYWLVNPATSAAWTKTEVDALEFGFLDTATDTVVRTSRCNRITEVNYATDDELWGQEIVHLISADNGDTWTAKRISENSHLGNAMIGGKMYYSNGRIEIIWSSGYDLFYYTDEPFGLVRYDARDLRIRWGDTEIDRIIDYANYEDTRIRFKLQEVLAAGATTGTKDYYVEYGNPNETTPPLSDPNNVLIAFENFETYESGETIAGERSWTANSGAGTAYYSGSVNEGNKVHAGRLSLKNNATTLDLQKALGSTYSGIHVKGAIWMEGYTHQWISLCDADGTEFGAGKSSGLYGGYYDGSWHADAVHRTGRNTYDVVEAQVTSKGGSAWVNGKQVADEVAVSGLGDITRLKCRTSSEAITFFDFIEVSRRLRKSGGVDDYQTIDTSVEFAAEAWLSSVHGAELQAWDGFHNDIHYDDAVTYNGVGRIDVTLAANLTEVSVEGTVYVHCWLSRGETYDETDIVEDQLGTIAIENGGEWFYTTLSFTGLLGGHYSVKFDYYAATGFDPVDIISKISAIKVYGYDLDPVVVVGEQEVKGFYVDACILGGRQIQLTIDATIGGYLFIAKPNPATLVARTVDPTVSIGYRVSPAAATLVAATVDPVVGIGVSPAAATLVAATVDPTVVLSSVEATPAAATLVAAAIDPTIILGSLAITPAASTLVTASIAPTAVLGSLAVTPAAASLIAAAVAPTVVLGNAEVTPSPASLVAATIAPTVAMSSVSVTPAPVSTMVATVNPTVVLGNVSITPTAATLVTGTITPTCVLSSATVIPDPVTLIAASVTPTAILGSLSITPAIATLVCASIAPTVILGSAVLTPAVCSLVTATIAPTVVLESIAITPSPATLVTASVDPTVDIVTGTVTPSPVTCVVATVAPTVILGTIAITPAAATLVAAMVAPTVVQGSIAVAPSAATLVTQSIAPIVVLGSVAITPTTAFAVVMTVNPAVVLGSLSVTPIAATLIATTVDPTPSFGGVTLTPSPASLAAVTISPTFTLTGATITPEAATAVLAVIQPTVILGNLSITPAVVSLVAATIDPTYYLDLISIAPAPVTLVLATVDPVLIMTSVAVTPSIADLICATVAPTLTLWEPTFTSPRIVLPNIKSGSFANATVRTNSINSVTVKQASITNLDLRG